jgi:hypothetical protein
MAQDKKARKANRMSFGQPGAMLQADVQKMGAGIPRPGAGGKGSFKRWHIRSFLNNVDKVIKEQGVKVPVSMTKEVGPGAAAIFSRMYEVAIRDNSENPRVYCPRCKQYHQVEISAKCPVFENGPDLPVKCDNVNLERNSMAVAMKIFDKFLPTLSSVTSTINIQGTITTVSAQLTQIIFKYVPPSERRSCFEEIDGLLKEISDQDRD